MIMEAIRLRGTKWAVRPQNQLGNCGWYPKPWQVIYVNASSPDEAIRKAEKL